MRYFLLLFICMSLLGCSDDRTTSIVLRNDFKGAEIVHHSEAYESFTGQYKILTMIKRTGSKRIKYLQLNASYYDQDGKKVAESIGGPEEEIAPGDSAVVSTNWFFPHKDKLPYKVVLSLSAF